MATVMGTIRRVSTGHRIASAEDDSRREATVHVAGAVRGLVAPYAWSVVAPYARSVVAPYARSMVAPYARSAVASYATPAVVPNAGPVEATYARSVPGIA
eukprot:3076305-Rhodomonas_salina.1